ncbi:MAG: LysR family transcriptional regulator [Phyllobacteriaceae bacterium]|nr:LysR family transcriptional regulator [Phyllobacteriaceae bacterium]
MDTLTRMRAYKDVVEAEGYSAAARRIGRSKALLSKYVRELEDELSTLLINRTTRQFSLTEAGHEYYARVVEILRDIDDLQDNVRQKSGDISGRIRVSAPRTLADSTLGQSFVDFASANPHIVLDITLDDRFVDLVEEGYDMAIRVADMSDSAMIARRLADFAISIYGAPALIERVGLPQTPRDLSERPCLVDTNGRNRNVWTFIDEVGERYTVAVPAPRPGSPTPGASMTGISRATCSRSAARACACTWCRPRPSRRR